jgi:acyl-CoA dehydrogenase
MSFSLPGDLDMLRTTVRRYVMEELRPLERTVEETDHLDADVFRRLREKAASIGLYAHNIPEDAGGGGISMLGQVVVGEELGRTCMPLADAAGFLPVAITRAAGAQREWFLDPVVRGEKTLAYALTEPDAGSDLSGLRMRASRSAGGWVVNGSKQFISGADIADFIIVLAVTDASAELRSRFTLFIVRRDDPGFDYLFNFRKMGWRGYQLGAFTLDNCELPEDRVLGEVGKGFAAIMDTINTTRIEYAGRYVGMADELLGLAIGYANERRTFGEPLASHQGIQFTLADCDCELEAARLLAYRAAALADAGDPGMRLAGTRAKLYASEMVGRVADRVLQVFGGAGYMCDFPVERMYRDARAFRIGEGTSEMLRIQVARQILKQR